MKKKTFEVEVMRDRVAYSCEGQRISWTQLAREAIEAKPAKRMSAKAVYTLIGWLFFGIGFVIFAVTLFSCAAKLGKGGDITIEMTLFWILSPVMIIMSIVFLVVANRVGNNNIFRKRNPLLYINYSLDRESEYQYQQLGHGINLLKNNAEILSFVSRKGIVENSNIIEYCGINRPIYGVYFPNQSGVSAIYFFPDAIWFEEYGQWITYGALSVKFDTYIEKDKERLPRDAHVVARKWKYANKNGDRDFRYKDNRELYSYECGRVDLEVTTVSGSNCEKMEGFYRILKDYCQFAAAREDSYRE